MLASTAGTQIGYQETPAQRYVEMVATMECKADGTIEMLMNAMMATDVQAMDVTLYAELREGGRVVAVVQAEKMYAHLSVVIGGDITESIATMATP